MMYWTLTNDVMNQLTLSVRVLRFIPLLVELEFLCLLRYRLSQSSQVYYIIGWVRVLRFITLSVEFSGLLRYRLS